MNLMSTLPEGVEEVVGDSPVLVLNDPPVGADDNEVPTEIWLEVDPLGS